MNTPSIRFSLIHILDVLSCYYASLLILISPSVPCLPIPNSYYPRLFPTSLFHIPNFQFSLLLPSPEFILFPSVPFVPIKIPVVPFCTLFLSTMFLHRNFFRTKFRCQSMRYTFPFSTVLHSPNFLLFPSTVCFPPFLSQIPTVPCVFSFPLLYICVPYGTSLPHICMLLSPYFLP